MFGLSVHTFQSNLNQCYGYCQHTQGLSLGSDPGPPWNQTLRNICHLYTLFLKHRANKRKSWELESVSLAPFHLFHQCSFLPAMCVWPCSPPPPQVAHPRLFLLSHYTMFHAAITLSPSPCGRRWPCSLVYPPCISGAHPWCIYPWYTLQRGPVDAQQGFNKAWRPPWYCFLLHQHQILNMGSLATCNALP